VTFIEASHHGGTRPTTRFLVVHTTENDQLGTAMDVAVANFFHNEPSTDQSPSSAHGVVDVDSIVRCVADSDIAYHAGPHANTQALGLEHIGRASFTAAQWNTPYTDGMLAISAKQFAAWCKAYSIPPVKIDAAGLLSGKRGICGHNDVRAAWPQDTTHTDPGRYWPWAKFLALVQAELNPAPLPVADAEAPMLLIYGRTGYVWKGGAPVPFGSTSDPLWASVLAQFPGVKPTAVPSGTLTAKAFGWA
jgi:N-acetyl-anhydromuramyl-L-alanine amidase AmpD